jgi:maltose O-acetyltransferase
MKQIIDRLALVIDNTLIKIKVRAAKRRLVLYENVHGSASLGSNVQLIGPKSSFYIGEGSYINEAILATGTKAIISIGERCAIGYRVSIKALTHNAINPCPNHNGQIEMIEKDIKIGNCCWIGDNVYIREGVSIGNNVVVGANSVVTKSFENNVVIAGVPARIISKIYNTDT